MYNKNHNTIQVFLNAATGIIFLTIMIALHIMDGESLWVYDKIPYTISLKDNPIALTLFGVAILGSFYNAYRASTKDKRPTTPITRNKLVFNVLSEMLMLLTLIGFMICCRKGNIIPFLTDENLIVHILRNDVIFATWSLITVCCFFYNTHKNFGRYKHSSQSYQQVTLKVSHE